jgi:glycosyltransferase involved in cell wall biosynthesis
VRVVYYTRPSFFDAALPLAAELAKRVELHLVLEVAPEAWRGSLFDLPLPHLHPGLHEARPVLEPAFPPTVSAYWRACASFQLLVHQQSRSLHAATFKTAARIARFLDDLAPDAVHFDDLTLRALSLLPAMRRHRTVVSVHDPQPHSGERSWRNLLTRRLMYGSARRFVLHNSAQRPAFANSLRVPEANIEVVHLGPYTAYQAWQRAAQPRTRPTVLFFGRISRYKGLEVLLGAMGRIAARVPNVRLVIAGQPLAGYQVPALPTLPSTASVELIDGYVSNAMLADLFQTADVVVCPYLDATQSGVVLTAYAFETPVVASRVGGLPEYVHHGRGGLLFEPGDEDQLAAAVVRVLSEAGCADRLRHGIRDLLREELNWTVAADKLANLYGDLRHARVARR